MVRFWIGRFLVKRRRVKELEAEVARLKGEDMQVKLYCICGGEIQFSGPPKYREEVQAIW